MSPLLLFPDFSIIALGFLLRRFWLAPAAWVTIEKLVYHVLFPCLLFYSVVKSNLSLDSVGVFALGAPTVIGSGLMLGLLAKPWSKMGRVDFASGLQIAYRFNSYIGLALVSRIGGQQAVANMAILLALGVPLCNILAVGSMSKGKHIGVLLEIIKNPLIIGTCAGIAFKLMGIDIAEPVMLTLERLAQSAVSLGLLAVGAGLVFSGLKGHWGESIWWLTVKLMLLPAIALTYVWATGLPPSQAQVLLTFSAIPSASSAYILAARMGGNAPLVACLISLSTVGAAISLPLVFVVAHYLGV